MKGWMCNAGLAAAAAVWLAGCGGSGGSGDSGDTTPPVFTSAATASVAENTTAVLTVMTDDAGASLAITGGSDAVRFALNGSALAFKAAPDFENPGDSDGDNVYEVTVSATDASANSAYQNISVTVADVDENKTAARVVVLKTGQTKSYDQNGNEVADGSVKDDGYYQAGAARSYTRNDVIEIVTDNTTGLMWQDDAAAEADPAEWAAAIDRCEALSLGGHDDWRVPTEKELLSLRDLGHFYASIDPEFHHVVPESYWSSTSVVTFPDSAWYADFENGLNGGIQKDDTHYVRCVRGEPLSESGLSRDGVKEVVTDSATGLMWQDDAAAAADPAEWEAVIDRCEALSLGGYSDWRLPSQNELVSLVDYGSIDLSVDPEFENVAPLPYWSSTSVASDPVNAWIVSFYAGHSNWYGKDNSYYVRCVREGE
jgi:hypothetical protein